MMPSYRIHPYIYTAHSYKCPLNPLLAQVNRYYERGEYEQAMKASRLAKYLNIAGVIAFAIFGCIMVIVVGVIIPVSLIRSNR